IQAARRQRLVLPPPRSPARSHQRQPERHPRARGCLSRLPAYVAALSNEDLINRQRGPGHPLRRLLPGCFEMALLVVRLRVADEAEVARCLDLIDALAAVSLATPAEGPIDCSKCLLKFLLFAAEIAHKPFPHRAQAYLFNAKRLMPERPMGW